MTNETTALSQKN